MTATGIERHHWLITDNVVVEMAKNSIKLLSVLGQYN